MIRVMSFLKAITGLKEEANDYRKLIGDISDKNQEFYAGGDASAEAGNENKI